jgi:DHA2 family multidrug resistance protein-like MFS transporter
MATTDASKAGPRERVGLGVLALAALVYVMDLTVLHLAVPAISRDLHPSSAQLLWIIDIYGFTVAGFLVTMGTLGDRVGRRKLLLVGAAAFGLISIRSLSRRSVASRAGRQPQGLSRAQPRGRSIRADTARLSSRP